MQQYELPGTFFYRKSEELRDCVMSPLALMMYSQVIADVIIRNIN
jgi:hypothetical protein